MVYIMFIKNHADQAVGLAEHTPALPGELI